MIKKGLLLIALILICIFAINFISAISINKKAGDVLDNTTWGKISNITDKIDVSGDNIKVNGKLYVTGSLCTSDGKCLGECESGQTWSNSTLSCNNNTKNIACSGTKPTGSLTNGSTNFLQSWDSSQNKYLPVSKNYSHNLTSGECNFKCDTTSGTAEERYYYNGTTCTQISPVNAINLVSKSSDKIKLSWSSVPNATKYMIQNYTDSGEWIYPTSTSYEFTNLQEGKEYQFVVNAITTYNGKVVLGTSYKATSKIRTDCSSGKHLENGSCLADIKSCTITNGSGQQTWNSGTNSRGSCIVNNCSTGYTSNGTSCVPNNCGSANIDGYSVSSLTHNQTKAFSRLVNITGGKNTYTQSFKCSLGSTSKSGTASITATSCNSGYTKSGNSCIPNNCLAKTDSGYSVSALTHNQTATFTRLISITGGSNTYSQAYQCNLGTTSKSGGESITATSCNSGYTKSGNSCIPNNCLAKSDSGYSVSALTHNQTVTFTKLISITGGSNTYSQAYQCNLGTTSKSGGESITATSCNSGYTKSGTSCIPNNCLAKTDSGYSVSALTHNQTATFTKLISITGGSNTYSQAYQCNLGTTSKSGGESITATSCNSGYTKSGTSCIPNNCLAKTDSGYSITTLTHGQTATFNKNIAIIGGTNTYSQAFACNLGNLSKNGGETNNISCNQYYHNEGGSCVLNNFSKETDFQGSDTQVWDYFGEDVDISDDGNTAIIGKKIHKYSKVGGAYIFSRSGNTWTQQQKLTDAIGYKVSISGDGNTVVLGASDENNHQGSIYIFSRSGDSWIQQQKISNPDGILYKYDHFGESIDINYSGDTIVVGTPQQEVSGIKSGSTYIFIRSGNNWIQQTKLLASDRALEDNFGLSVSISGDGNTITIGSQYDDDQGDNSGSVYVFTRSGNTRNQQAKLTASDGKTNYNFGSSVSISSDGETIVIGARNSYYHINTTCYTVGAAYIFTHSGNTRNQQAKLTASDGNANDYFGGSVSISGDGNTVVISAEGNDGKMYDSGSIYTFTRSGNVRGNQQKFYLSVNMDRAYFGNSVSISSNGGNIIVGCSQFHPQKAGRHEGAVYIFSR